MESDSQLSDDKCWFIVKGRRRFGAVKFQLKILNIKDRLLLCANNNIGSRFVLTNTVPIKGLQVVMYLKNTVALDTTDIIYPRASMMRAEVKSVGKEVSVILWNVNNLPIEPGNLQSSVCRFN